MSGTNDAMATVTIRVNRFAPKAERKRERSSSPFSSSRSPFSKNSVASPRKIRGKHWVQDYTLHASAQDTILDCLLTIKRTVDPTLAFRYSCGHGMCGSDAVNVNGTPTLLCTATVGEYAKPHISTNETAGIDHNGFRKTMSSTAQGNAVNAPAGTTNTADAAGTPSHNTTYPNHDDATSRNAFNTVQTAQGDTHDIGSDLGIIELEALPGFPVERDLIADIDPMLDQITKLKPYLQAKGELATTSKGNINVFEYLQKPEQLAQYELLSNCIACGVCEGACPVFAGGDAFIGPAALITASRFINDSRDGAANARFDAIDTADGIAACQSVRACGRKCPRGIDVGEEMWQLITRVNER
jgi:succinate dehydrogenase / fumarate reductase iron-sulfur subunit